MEGKLAGIIERRIYHRSNFLSVIAILATNLWYIVNIELYPFSDTEVFNVRSRHIFERIAAIQGRTWKVKF